MERKRTDKEGKEGKNNESQLKILIETEKKERKKGRRKNEQEK
jgi:hypothetical protein